jgi:arylsulfatase A-like enzyme
MKKYSPLIFLLTLSLCATLSLTVEAQVNTAKKPNIILIVTDDLGYGDLGVFYQNLRKSKNDRAEPWMQTPNLDQLAASGAMLTNNYCAAPVCAPSRASLMLGVSQGHANVRDNQFDKAIEDNYTIGNVLQSAGYTTAVIGKWGLQGLTADWPAHPLNRGFDYFFGYMRHSDGHEHYPKEGLYRKPKQIWENRTEISQKLDKCYTGDLFTAIAKKWIIDQSKAKMAKPFFMFLAYDNPHAALELPTQQYPSHGGLTGGMQWIGKTGEMINTASGKIDSYVHPDYVNATYDHDHNVATPEIPWPDTFKRYATIVRRIDDQVGDLIQLLKDLKIYANTMVVFTSDNGASIESYLPKEFTPNRPDFFNSFGPFDGIKRDVWEGGMRMPTLISWPNLIKPNLVIENPSISYDFLPTFAQAAGLTTPVKVNGVSLISQLTGKGKINKSLIYTEYFEKGVTPDFVEFDKSHQGRRRNQMQMIRVGDTLGVRYSIKSADDDFEIYNIKNDKQQANNLAKSQNTRSLQQYFKTKVLQVRVTDTAAQRPYDNVPISGISGLNFTKGLTWNSYQTNSKWIPEVSDLSPLKTGKIAMPDVKLLPSDLGNLMVYNGFVLITEEGKYDFQLSANGKAFLKIHEINLIDEDFNYKSNTTKSRSLNLKVGYHPITLFYLKEKGLSKPQFNFKIINLKSPQSSIQFYTLGKNQ